jgi:DNA-binding MarR family transcriptional regulator
VIQATASRPSVEELSAELMLYTGRLVRAVTRQSSGVAAQVPAASLRLLSQIEELAPVTIGALAMADRCSQPTMSAGVASLCDRGWATKQPNPRDARSSLVTLTDAGHAVLVDARHERAALVAARLRADPEHDEHDLATAVAVLRGLLARSNAPDSPHPNPPDTSHPNPPDSSHPEGVA